MSVSGLNWTPLGLIAIPDILVEILYVGEVLYVGAMLCIVGSMCFGEMLYGCIILYSDGRRQNAISTNPGIGVKLLHEPTNVNPGRITNYAAGDCGCSSWSGDTRCS